MDHKKMVGILGLAWRKERTDELRETLCAAIGGAWTAARVSKDQILEYDWVGQPVQGALGESCVFRAGRSCACRRPGY